MLSPSSTKRANRIALEENINAEVLSQMKSVFDQADTDGGGFLDIDEFIEAFLGVLSTKDGSDEIALRKLFMRVDVNADNVLDWNEFLSYMLLHKEHSNHDIEESRTRRLVVSSVQTNVSDKSMHRELITSITKIPPGAGDLYITTSKDGSILAWTAKDLGLWKAIRQRCSWITCSAFLPVTKAIAVADFSRCVWIYDSQNLYSIGNIHDLPYTALCMTSWKVTEQRDVEYLCLGDLLGNVMLYEMSRAMIERKNPDQFNHKLRWQKRVHEDLVTSIVYIEELNCIISASTDSTLTVMDTEQRTPLKRLIGHKKGVNTCAWSSFYKFVCSGGQDRTLILWNPFSQKPLTTLLGHAAPILAITVHDTRNALISLSTDKCIKVVLCLTNGLSRVIGVGYSESLLFANSL
eukprot:g704.t1